MLTPKGFSLASSVTFDGIGGYVGTNGADDSYRVRMLSDAEMTAVAERIREAELNPGKRTGGIELGNMVRVLATHRKRFDDTIAAIRQILEPKTRQSAAHAVAEALAIAQAGAVKRIAATFQGFDEKILRQIGQGVLGDTQLDFTADELPEAIARAQLAL